MVEHATIQELPVERADVPDAPSTRRGVTLAVTGMATGIGLAAAAVWLRSRAGETALDAQTRDRLQPRAPGRTVPSAADIKVA